MKERKRRSFLKAITWRALATLITVGLVWVFSKNFVLAFSIGVLEATLKLLFYYFHERAWGKIRWGILK